MRRLAGSVLFSVLAVMAASVGQAQEEDPDLAFLEYLGSWQEGDEEWEVVAEMGPEAVPPVDGKPEAVEEENEDADDE